ncbi:hypothetical protein M407DRAFT_11691 [Tulasnella calospora MUT 4182]|uniref:Uncharacterized protein n=1 Tax=Tulasnella calospora MUT 4182 TaxID=1051891 RepID=A0A0C3KBQ2_9AGAM|nr:hypothetical protein M407DRAFT_11691 [Tulasnella calospora MUT 4182]
MLSTLYSTSTPSTDNLDPATLRRASAHRHSLAPLPIIPSMDDYRFGAQSNQSTDGRLSQDLVQQLAMSSRSSSRHRSHRSASSSTRRASLPLLSTTQAGIVHTTHPHPYLPSPRSSTFRHRPSVSSVTTNGTSGSTSTSTNDETMMVQQPQRDASPELSGIYRDMQSYVFGASSSSSQQNPSASTSASTNLHPFAPGPSSLRNVRAASRQSSSANSISVAAAMHRSSLYDDTDMNDLSDAGSAYSPEDDALFLRSQRQSTFAATTDRMDIDQERKLSRDMSAGLPSSSGRASARSMEKKRERGTRHSRGPGFSSAALAMTRYDADRSEEPSTDEDDSNRAMERSKMRAIDDGSRRPSLPTNVHHGPDIPSHNWAQASTAAAAAPISPTTFRFGAQEAAVPAQMSISSIPGSPTTPTAATFNGMMLAAANSAMGSAQLQSYPSVSLQPLNMAPGASGAMARSVSSPSKVSLDLMSVAAATGRMTSVHNQAFDTLSPEDGQVVLEQLKQRSSLRIRISRAFGGNGGSKDSGAPNGSNHGDDSSRDGRSASPHVVAVGKPHKDHHHHHHAGRDDPHHGHTSGPHEAAFEPPWMLMTPMYVKEAVIAAERSMYTGFASLGLAVQPSKKSKRQAPPPSPVITPAMRRNSVLDSVPNEAMCMLLPLWDLTLDLEEDKRRRRQMVDDLDIDLDDLEEEDEDEQEEDAVDEMLVDEVVDAEALERKRLVKELAKRRKLMPPPRVERKYLLAYYVPFDAKRQSMAATTSPPPPPVPPLPNDHRTSKKRPRQGTNAAAPRPSLQRRNSGSSATKPLPVKSFRVIARILTPAELRDSGLNPPRNIVDPKRMQQQSTSYFHSSLNYHRMDRRLSSSSIFGDVVPSAFNAVIAVCNDRRRGVEFVPEGLDSLGLCGGETLVGPNGAVEKLPPLFPPAHMVPVKERLTPPLNAVGRQIVEMIWGGCLALTELGI